MAAESPKPPNTFRFENLSDKKGIIHFISTRVGGISKPPFDGLNISFNVGDDPKNVLYNRNLLAQAMGFKLHQLTTAKQVHGDKVVVVTRSMSGRGSKDYRSALDGTDAMITNVPKICIMVHVADCVPLLFYDPKKKVIGAAHAGWKGTALKIASKTVKSMMKIFRSDPGDIYVGIGPSIGKCCYEVGKEVSDRFEKCVVSGSNLDLWEANRIQLINEGIPEANIEVAGICTKCASDSFFSSRAGKGTTGRFGAGIMLL